MRLNRLTPIADEIGQLIQSYDSPITRIGPVLDGALMRDRYYNVVVAVLPTGINNEYTSYHFSTSSGWITEMNDRLWVEQIHTGCITILRARNCSII